MKLAQVAGLSDPGRVRRRNEDAFVCDPPLFAVADGMGGAQAGEVASRLAAAAFHEYHEADALDPEARLRSIIQEANRRIYARASTDPHASGMGTTITAALVTGSRVSVGHVGDSRAYLFRDEVLEQLTEDHSLVADLVRSGRLTPEEAEAHPQRSVITRALGTDAAVSVDSFSVEAKPGDVYLLCSDGLTTMLSSDSVRSALAETSTLEEAARRLIGEANAAGGEDNVTVVLFAVTEAGADEDTLSGLEGFRVPLPEPVPEPDPEAQPSGGVTVVQRPVLRPTPTNEVLPPPRRRTRRWAIIVLAVIALFVGLAALALWGLSSAHFVGATADGRVAVYQGVPWDIGGDVKLYRETYVSRLQVVQLSPSERKQLFDHDLTGEDAAIARIRPYENELP
jgi:serine/threonine protein phosphatase PrpC